MDSYEAWEPWRLPDVFVSGGPESTLCDDPPESMPTSGRVGFTAPV